jgi:coproporphyrinogen III oxidase-like Fe-S oxidoreductase
MIKLLSSFLGFITQYEGRKFLKLSDEIDETKITLTQPLPSRERNKVRDRDEQTALYVHIPFCRSLCPYCCFNRYLFTEDKARRYFKNLRTELDFYIQKGAKFSTFYFGGGTPTVMMDELLGFISYLKEKFEVKQISVETTPREVSQENVNLLKEVGVNRLSIGVQSFNDQILQSMGRAFCAGEEIREKISIANGKFDTLNVDLIFNFPSQSIEEFERDIEITKSLGISQVTFYPLMPSPHKRNALERRFNQVDTSREEKFYNIILKNIDNDDFHPSTAWCFSKGKRIIDEYIVDFDDYIGIGAGSASLLRGNFYINSFSLDRYEELITQGKLPIIRWRKLSQHELLYYYLLSKLFGMKLNKEKFHQRFNADIHRKLWKELLFLKLFGLVQEEDGEINVTRKGMYPTNVIMREFFSSLNSLREYCIENQI